MTQENLPTSTRIALAQTRRERRRRGVLRARIVAGAFGAAVVLGAAAGCLAPGA